ncbi:hypothetical protein HAZT_HAZT003184 [Hyalella azteca]|uniref:glucose-6-phosphatase n=1 Tax=Hyalella azteca TaxID=294128 RepID=A0A6A0H5X8_HYAAZ|nr:hypothetical protein HAZT_HAZT003184 [Hyalella azteca]
MNNIRLSSWESWIVRVSVVGDNREAFVFFFPMLSGLSILCGAKLLWAAILVEWSNVIMKWVFRGDRPFWYVQETPFFNNETRPVLRQFHNTCESGPGTPSGHLMMNVAIFYIFTRSICQLFIWDNRFLSRKMQRSLATGLFSTYSTWIALVFLSRLYIQAHFIHQCVLGVLAGTVWMSLVKLGYDPMWSVAKALKHCYDPVHVRVDAQPFFIMARFTGSALGLGLGMSSQLGQQAAGLPTREMSQYLTLGLGVHAALPYTIITTVPYILTRLLPQSTTTIKKKNN